MDTKNEKRWMMLENQKKQNRRKKMNNKLNKLFVLLALLVLVAAPFALAENAVDQEQDAEADTWAQEHISFDKEVGIRPCKVC